MTAVTERLQARLGERYRFERHVGSGGMATVYLAEDLKHHRRVALKVLRPELSALLGTERFLKEIEVTAGLQHPHLLPLFDSGEADGLLYYVMPYVEGESLRQKLTRERQLGVAEAVRLTSQIGSALEYAHRHGVIHRDIKPENILLHEGQASIADFGIALAVREAGGDRLTQTGLSLGTPQYMSPEQAAGDREVDLRSDVYSLAAVLYEMLVGEPPHTGPTVQSIIAKLLAEQPRPIRGLRASVPVHIAAALDVALAKLPADRFEAMAAFVQALESPAWLTTTAAGAYAASHATTRAAWRSRPVLALAAATVLLGVSTLWLSLRGTDPAAAVPVVADIPTDRPIGDAQGQFRLFDVSPDGKFLAYAERGAGIVLRPLGDLAAVHLRDTDGASFVAFSPDSKELAFTRQGRLLRVPLAGGAQTEVARAPISAGLHWGDDGHFYFASGLGTAGIWRVGVGGGEVTNVTSVRDSDNENAHTWPQALPGGKSLLYTALGPSGGPRDSRLVVQSLDSDKRVVLVEGASHGRFLKGGYLLFVRDDSALYAVRFDPKSLSVLSAPVAVEPKVRFGTWSGAGFFAVSDNGVEIYMPPSDRPGYAFVFVDRSGRVHAPVLDSLAQRQIGPGTTSPRLSPDGRAVLFMGRHPGSTDIWVSRSSSAVTRLTLDPAEDEFAVWSPAGDSVAYTSANTGMSRRIFVRSATGGGEPRLVRTWPRHVHVTAWSRDGRWLALSDYTSNRGQDIWAISLDGRDSLPIATGPAMETFGVFSPDGRWIAFVSDESGRTEIFLTPFPTLGVRRQITTSGASAPRWDASARALYYLSNGALMSLPMTTDGPMASVAATMVFRTQASTFDVSTDAQRFVLQLANETPSNYSLRVRTGFLEHLRRILK